MYRERATLKRSVRSRLPCSSTRSGSMRGWRRLRPAGRGSASSRTARSRPRTAASSSRVRRPELPAGWDAIARVDLAGRWITPGLDRLPHPPGLRRRPRARVRAAARRRQLRGDRARPAAASSRPSRRPGRRARTNWSPRRLPRLDRADRRGRHHRSRSSPATASSSTPRRACCAPRGGWRSERAGLRWSRPFSARTRCRRKRRRQGAPISTRVCDADAPAVARERPRRRGRCLLRGHRLLARADRARVRRGQGRRPAGQAARRPALQPARRDASPPSYGALSADHLEYTDEDGVAAMAAAGTVAVLLPGAFYFLRETQSAAGRCLPPARRAASRSPPTSNPGSSPLTSLLLAMNMARDPVPADRRRVPSPASPARRRARSAGSARSARSSRASACDLAIWDVERPAELVYRMGFNPLHARVWRGQMTAVDHADARTRRRSPTGARSIAARACGSIPPPCRRSRPSARAVDAIIARGEPVYGINTGFGKLASVRIEAADLATLQRNIVLSHAAGVGEPMPAASSRLMMALKLASLAQGASGVRPATVAMLRGDARRRTVVPVIPCQGSVGASGDLAPLAHMAAAMIGVGEVAGTGRRAHAGRRGARARRAAAARARPEGRPGAAQRHAVLDRLCARRPVRGRDAVPGGAGHRRAVDRRRAGSDAPFDPRIHALRRHRGQIEIARPRCAR